MIKRTLLVATLLASAAQAQTLQQQMSKCLGITGTLQRLACYDGLAHGAGLTASASAPVYAPAPVRPAMPAMAPPPAYASAAPPLTPTQQFGAERLASTQAQVRTNSSIHADVVNFELDARQKFTVTLSNGQVWRQVPGDDAVAKPRRSMRSVTIERAIFGSYALTFNDATRLFKVTRVS